MCIFTIIIIIPYPPKVRALQVHRIVTCAVASWVSLGLQVRMVEDGVVAAVRGVVYKCVVCAALSVVGVARREH